MTPEELDQWIDSLETEDEGIPEYLFSNPDPYFKIQPSAQPKNHNFWFSEDGHIRVKNISVSSLIGATVSTGLVAFIVSKFCVFVIHIPPTFL